MAVVAPEEKFKYSVILNLVETKVLQFSFFLLLLLPCQTKHTKRGKERTRKNPSSSVFFVKFLSFGLSLLCLKNTFQFEGVRVDGKLFFSSKDVTT